MDKIILQDLEIQISEMWDAVVSIDNPADRDTASEQAQKTENKLREAYRKQERLRDSAPELLFFAQASLLFDNTGQYEYNGETLKGREAELRLKILRAESIKKANL